MVFLPFSLGHFPIWVNDLTLAIKHRFLKLPFINFSILPFKLTWPVDLIPFEITFKNSILCLDSSLSFPLSTLELSIVLYSSSRLNPSILIMHQASTELSHIFTTTVIPCIGPGPLLKTRLKTTEVACTLLITSLNSVALRKAILPKTLNCVNIFMCEDPLAVHGGVFNFPLVIAAVGEDYKGLIIISFTISELSLVISIILKNSDSKSFRQFIITKFTLIISPFRRYIEKRFSLHINFLI